MKSSNFTDLRKFRSIIAENRQSLGLLVTRLINAGIIQSCLDSRSDKAFREFPFVLTHDLESQLPEIHEARYLKDIMGQENIPISHTDALWLHRGGVPFISPFSIGVEAATMSLAFGLLLPIFEEHFAAADPAQVFALLLITCLVLYPAFYMLLNKIYSWQYGVKQRYVPDYKYVDLMNESFRLFTVLVCALVGLDLFDVPLQKAAVGAGVAVPLLEIFKKIHSIGEWTPTVIGETIRDILTSGAIFAPLMYIINSLPQWLPQAALKFPYLPLINVGTVLIGLPALARIIGTLSFKLTDCFYVFNASTVDEDAPLLGRDSEA
jgi:hypothetical protein